MKTTIVSLLFAAFTTSAMAYGPVVMPKDHNEVFPPRDLSQGTARKSKAECDATPNAVWVTASWVEKGLFSESKETTTECIRYFPSDNAIGAKTATFWYHGDVMEVRGKGNSETNPGYDANNYKAQVAIANRDTRENGIPFVIIARLGTYGSTGNTNTHRHSKKEIEVMRAATDAVKAAFGYERINAAGLSGGATFVGSLLTSGRTDLDCVAIGSGAVSYKTRMKTSKKILDQHIRSGYDTTGLSLDDVYDPLDDLKKIAADPKRRIFMLSGKLDEAVSYESQKEFADKANAAGIPIMLIDVEGFGAEKHGTTFQSTRTIGRCVAGLDDDTIRVKAMINAPAINNKKPQN